MKYALFFSLLLFFTTSLIGQVKIQPIQIQTIDTAQYVVEYIPLATAQKNVSAQITQVDKQLATVEKQMADLLKKRDELMRQKAALELVQKQLDQAAATPPPTTTAPQSAPPPAEPPKTKKKKSKN